MNHRVVCWGEALWDLFPDGPKLGGAVANVAYHLALLGRKPAMVTRVGDDDLGKRAVATLEAAGVNCHAVQIDRERVTGAVDITLEAGEPRYRLRAGCAWERIACSQAAVDLIGAADALVFGTLAQRTQDGLAGWTQAMACASTACIKVCDPNLRTRYLDARALDAHLEAATVVKINEAEAAAIADSFDVADPVAWLIEQRGMNLVALTRGAGGCSLITRGERADYPGVAATPGGDNVGAGDAFVAVLISGLLAGDSLADIATLGCRYGAHVASHRGATPSAPAWLDQGVIS